MPDFTFHGPCPLNYTEGRDAQGRNLGLAVPHEIRDLDEAPDHWWHESTDEDRAFLAAREAAEAGAQQSPGTGTEMHETGDPADDGPDGGEPEAPAPVVPQAAPPAAAPSA